jgi:hypothetical protein
MGDECTSRSTKPCVTRWARVRLLASYNALDDAGCLTPIDQHEGNLWVASCQCCPLLPNPLRDSASIVAIVLRTHVRTDTRQTGLRYGNPAIVNVQRLAFVHSGKRPALHRRSQRIESVHQGRLGKPDVVTIENHGLPSMRGSDQFVLDCLYTNDYGLRARTKHSDHLVAAPPSAMLAALSFVAPEGAGGLSRGLITVPQAPSQRICAKGSMSSRC